MSYQILTKEIKQGITRGVYLFYGPEEYLKRHYAKEIEKLIVDPVVKDVSYTLFEGKPDLAAVFDACTAYPFFGDKKLVVIKDSGLFKPAAGSGETRKKAKSAGTDKKAGKAGSAGGGRSASAGASSGMGASAGASMGASAGDNADTGAEADTGADADTGAGASANAHDSRDSREAFGVLLDKLPDFTCLLIIEQEIDKRLGILNKVSSKGLVVEFSLRTPEELENWVVTIAAHGQKQFTKNAVKYFIENSGESMSGIKIELDKLLAYAADKPGITLDDVKEVCRASLKIRIFDLLDHIVAGNRRMAVIELESLLREREPAMRILSMISNHLILMRQMKGFAESGAKLIPTTKLMGLNPYRAEKIWKQCARVSPASLAGAIEMCYRQDKAIKSGKINDVLGVQLLIASLSL